MAKGTTKQVPSEQSQPSSSTIEYEPINTVEEMELYRNVEVVDGLVRQNEDAKTSKQSQEKVEATNQLEPSEPKEPTIQERMRAANTYIGDNQKKNEQAERVRNQQPINITAE